MQFSLDTIAALATVVGTAVSILALFQSHEWLMLISSLVVCLSLGVGWYARQKRMLLNSAATVVEGYSIDSLNIANLRRTVNRKFTVQAVHHTVRITGEDMEITWKYTGFCRQNDVSSMEFSLDAEDGTPFARLKCAAFDLIHDPEMAHPIRPLLIGTDGISKKVSVPFLKTLSVNEPFGVQLTCTLPGCIKPGFGYYTSTSSFDQSRIRQCTVRLIFDRPAPKWLRVYDTAVNGSSRLVKTLPPIPSGTDYSEYVDVIDDRRGQSARIYAFWRDSHENQT